MLVLSHKKKLRRKGFSIMAFDDQDRVNHTDTENRSEEHPTAEGTQQKNEEEESSG